tara:strand:- start:605 stop:1561 length:957 start_codon:yes stop_codon:yes gene_type:complete
MKEKKQMKKLKILITGGSGFIGSNLYNELTKRKHEVYRIDLNNSNLSNYERCDVNNIRILEKIINEHTKFDYVYHLAAEYGRWNGEDFYESLWRSNVIGTKNILDLQRKYKFKLIFFSSAEVYGDYNGIMSEDVMINNKISDTYMMNDYAISKWAGEMMCMNAFNMHGNEIVRVRPVNCYGPFEHYTPYRGFIPKFIYLALKNEGYTVYLNHKRIIDYVEDSCVTISNIIDNFIQGEAYNIGSKVEWERDIKDYSDIILKSIGIDDSKIIYKESEPNTTKIKTMDFSKSINDLNHNPVTSPEVGIKKTVDWMKANYSI